MVDDYAHHPVEIAAVLSAARAIVTGKLIAVVQPHRYTRTRDLAFPGGMPQERTIAFVYFLNQYGPALVDRLLQLLPLEPRHWVLTV